MFNPLLGQQVLSQAAPTTPQTTTQIRQVSPLQLFTAAELQQAITGRLGPLVAPLHSIPGLVAEVPSVAVDATQARTVITLQLRLQSGGLLMPGQVRILTGLTPIPQASIGAVGPVNVCMPVLSRFFDLGSLPLSVQQQIQSVIQTLFAQTVCLPMTRPVRQGAAGGGGGGGGG